MWEYDGRTKAIEGVEVHGVTNKETGKKGGFIAGMVKLSNESIIDEGSCIINYSKNYPLYLHNCFIMGSEIKIARGGVMRDCFLRDSTIFDEFVGMGSSADKRINFRTVNLRSGSRMILRYSVGQNIHNCYLNLNYMLAFENSEISIGYGTYKDIMVGEGSKFIVRPGFYRNVVNKVKIGNNSMFNFEMNNPLVASKIYVDSGREFILVGDFVQYFSHVCDGKAETIIDNVWLYDNVRLEDMENNGLIIKDLTVELGKPIRETIPEYAKQNIIRDETKI